jgi:hypothetical protein
MSGYNPVIIKTKKDDNKGRNIKTKYLLFNFGFFVKRRYPSSIRKKIPIKKLHEIVGPIVYMAKYSDAKENRRTSIRFIFFLV